MSVTIRIESEALVRALLANEEKWVLKSTQHEAYTEYQALMERARRLVKLFDTHNENREALRDPANWYGTKEWHEKNKRTT
jgi:hypothetical protein